LFLDDELKSIQEEAKKRANNIPLSVVRLQFEVLLKPEGKAHRRLPPVYTKPIYDSSKLPTKPAVLICVVLPQCRHFEFLAVTSLKLDDIFWEKISDG
jgi:hypothetical protein